MKARVGDTWHKVNDIIDCANLDGPWADYFGNVYFLSDGREYHQSEIDELRL